MLPIAAEIATRLTREQAQSALPDAPLIPDEDVKPARASLVSLVLGLTDTARTGDPGATSRRRIRWPRRAVNAELGRPQHQGMR